MPDATDPDKKNLFEDLKPIVENNKKVTPFEIHQAAGTTPVPTDVAKLKLLGNKAKLSQREVDQRAKVREMEDHIEELKEEGELAYLDVENTRQEADDQLEVQNKLEYLRLWREVRYLQLEAENKHNKLERAINSLKAYLEDIS